MAPIIDIIRHAEAAHNIQGSHLSDPGLTAEGRQQASRLAAAYPYGNQVARIVASPMRRTIETACRAFRRPIARGARITLLPELQEVNSSPSGTGSPAAVLREVFGEYIDTALLGGEDWYLKGPDTPFAPDATKVDDRARWARIWLRDLARSLAASSSASPSASTQRLTRSGGGGVGDEDRNELRIVVVTHGEFVHWLTGDFSGVSEHNNTGWRNAEVRSFRFAEGDGDGDDATLVETAQSVERRGARSGLSPPQPTLAENMRLRDTAADRAEMHAIFAAEAEWEDVVEEADAAAGP